MTEISGVGGTLLNRLFALADKDRDSKVSGAEMSELLDKVGQKGKIDQVMAAQDADKDGALSLEEWPGKLLSSEAIGQLLTAQDYKAMSPASRAELAQQAKDAYFARVDVDGNGVLNREEIEADKVMNQANYLDNNALPNVAVMFRAGADRNAITKDDIMVGQRLDLSAMTASPIKQIAEEDMSDAEKEMLRIVREGAARSPDAGAPPAPVPVPETPEAARERVSSSEFTSALLSRLLAQFGRGTTPGADAGNSAA
ncbi:hypothetical protein [Devosia sp. FKR38]|uniref:hypothetical protein n=1 Tax=Devosia sp. FKR38 TaxID=2562312 RepID=UPI001485400E|nr:hypothetical protein [Devosia sp. FKR38]